MPVSSDIPTINLNGIKPRVFPEFLRGDLVG